MNPLDEQIDREFLRMPLARSTMTFYTVRTSILSAIRRETENFHGDVLDVGCGFMPYRKLIEQQPEVVSYTGLDLEQPTYYADVEPHLRWDGRMIPAQDSAFDCAMATEFLEHVADAESVLREIYRVLKPGGLLLATVPFIWNLHEIPYDEYRYTPYSLERILHKAGFAEIEIKPLGGWNMALAQMIGLWIGFSPMGDRRRKLLSNALFPFYKLLVRTDRTADRFDAYAGSMFNGLCATARKPLGEG